MRGASLPACRTHRAVNKSALFPSRVGRFLFCAWRSGRPIADRLQVASDSVERAYDALTIRIIGYEQLHDVLEVNELQGPRSSLPASRIPPGESQRITFSAGGAINLSWLPQSFAGGDNIRLPAVRPRYPSGRIGA